LLPIFLVPTKLSRTRENIQAWSHGNAHSSRSTTWISTDIGQDCPPLPAIRPQNPTEESYPRNNSFASLLEENQKMFGL
jgi:hypothetical protein